MRTRTKFLAVIVVLSGFALINLRSGGSTAVGLARIADAPALSDASREVPAPSPEPETANAQKEHSAGDELEEATRDYAQRCAESSRLRQELEETDAHLEALSADIQAGTQDDATYDRFNEFAKQRAKLMLTLVKCQVAHLQVGGSAGETETNNRKGEENERL